MPPLPSAVRAAVGLVVTVLDEAKTLPDKAIELPMLAISKTLQLSLRAQRSYAALAARGDEVLAARNITDTPPEWATFDAPVDGAASNGARADTEEVADEPPAGPAKSIPAPRTGKPSAFDTVADE
jgi:hypothetical protein